MQLKTIVSVLVLGFSLASHAALSEVREGADDPRWIPRVQFSHPTGPLTDLWPYSHLDPQHEVPARILEQAVRYFETNRMQIPNQKFLTIVDLQQHSRQQRMYVIDLQSGAVRRFWVAHGSGSDRNADGLAEQVSNIVDSHMSSKGFYLTGGSYFGSNRQAMYLHGLESSNSLAYERAIVFHGADYVNPQYTGMSWGCPAVENRFVAGLIAQLKEGSLFYVHFDQ